LATLILSQPDILILDEPTNHLDIPSREALEESLAEYGGTVIAVSHDRYFLDRAVRRLLVIRHDRCRVFDGNYTTYIGQLELERRPEPAPARTPASRPSKSSPAPAKKTSKYDHLSIEQLEEMLIDRETRLAALHERFGEPAVNKDPDLLAELQENAESLAMEIAEIDAAWQGRAESYG
jgi:ATP-binding cassette subfamily F protein 3